MTDLTARQRQVLEFIDTEVRRRGYPPSVREIGEAVGLSSPSTVHAHLAALQDKGYLRRDPTKPRAIEISLDTMTGSAAARREAGRGRGPRAGEPVAVAGRRRRRWGRARGGTRRKSAATPRRSHR